MEKKDAIEFLEEKLLEIKRLRNLPHNNQEYVLWRNIIKSVLETVFDKDSFEYRTFFDAGNWYGHVPEAEIMYIELLKRQETALKSIIQKYEILGIEEKAPISLAPEEIFQQVSPKAFISHGKQSAALRKLKEFIETLGIEPIVVKVKASLDKTVDDKVEYYLNQADFVVILATGDDTVKDKITGEEKKQPRQNVIHEIGLAQKTHPGRIIYLLEEGAEFPSNIRPKVWESFKQRNMMDAFLGIVRELRAYGIMQVTKFPIEEQPS